MLTAADISSSGRQVPCGEARNTGKETAHAPAVSVSDLEEPLTQGRNAAKTLKLVMDTVLEAKHPLPTPPGSVDLVLGADQVEAAHFATEQVRCRARKVWDT